MASLTLEQITAEHFHRQFNVNVLGLLLVAFIPWLTLVFPRALGFSTS